MSRLFDNNTANYMSLSAVTLGLNGLTELSCAYWLNLASTASTQYVVSKQLTANDGWASVQSRFNNPASTLRFEIDNFTLTQSPLWEITAPATGAWHRILFTWKRNAITSADGLIYVDGVSTSVSFTAGGYGAAFTLEEDSNGLYYGKRPIALTSPLNGSLAWVTVWNRQLTATEALVDYNDPRSVTAGRLHCVECNSDTDLSGYGNDMTVTGTLADAGYWPTRREGHVPLYQNARYPGRGPKSPAVRFYQSPTGTTPAAISTAVFRKTLSSVGSRTGSRQLQAS